MTVWLTKDCDRGCQDVLTAFCGPEDSDEHVGTNVLQHMPLIASQLPALREQSLLGKIQSIMMTQVDPTLWCHRHQRCCLFQACEIDVSGFPCIDWSPAGTQQGVFGSTFILLVGLLAWHRQRRTKLVFLENVPEFDTSILESLMGDLYTMKVFYIEPSDAACEHISRMRVFICLLLRGRAVKTFYTINWLDFEPAIKLWFKLKSVSGSLQFIVLGFQDTSASQWIFTMPLIGWVGSWRHPDVARRLILTFLTASWLLPQSSDDVRCIWLQSFGLFQLALIFE